MPFPQTIDLEALLVPISEEAPAGVDPRSDSSANALYYRVKDARNAARSAERATVEVGGPDPEEWDTVVDTAIEILSSHAKDLEISAWLIEGLVRRDGFAGLRDGLQLVTGIVQIFWEQCFPEVDEEDGIEGKVSAIAGLSGSGAVGTLIQPIRLIPITHGSQWSFSYWSLEQATDLEKIADPARKQERIDSGAVTMEQFLQSIAETPGPEIVDIVGAVDECSMALTHMSTAFDASAGTEAPSISALRDLLQEISSAIRHFAADKIAAVSAITESNQIEDSGTGEELPDGSTVVAAPVRKINGYSSREEALAELKRIADYFKKTEPHSPISYTLEDAVRRARMSLPELLEELAEDPAHMQRILMAAGIRPTQAETEAS